MKKVFTIELSKKDGTLLTGEKAPLYYCVIKENDEHIATRQTLNPDRAKLLGIQLLMEAFEDAFEKETKKEQQ